MINYEDSLMQLMFLLHRPVEHLLVWKMQVMFVDSIFNSSCVTVDIMCTYTQLTPL